MAVTTTIGATTISDHNRQSELKAFDDTKAAVKGLVDAGVAKIPRILVHEKIKLDERGSQFCVPIIDLNGIDKDEGLRGEIVGKVKDACEKYGFFQAINHGIPASVMEGMIEGVRRFFAQDTDVKKQFYSRDNRRTFIYKGSDNMCPKGT